MVGAILSKTSSIGVVSQRALEPLTSSWFLLGFSFGFLRLSFGSSSTDFRFVMDRRFDFAPNFTLWSTMTNVKSGKVAFEVFLGFFQTSSSQPGHGRIPLNSHQTSATSLRRIPKDLFSGTWIAPETVPKPALEQIEANPWACLQLQQNQVVLSLKPS